MTTRRQRASQKRREVFWAGYAAQHSSPAGRAQVAWDRLRARVRDLPAPAADQAWERATTILDRLAREVTDGDGRL